MLRDRRGSGLRVPLLSVRGEQEAAVGADRERVADLLLGLRRAERQHGDLAAVLLDEPHGLLDAALLVRADREAEVARLERLLVVCQDHPAARERHPLDADEDPHAGTGPAAFTRSLSGSKTGVEPATATVTG